MIRDNLVLNALELLKNSDQKGIENLGLTDDEILVLEDLWKEYEKYLVESETPVDYREEFKGNLGALKAGALGLIEKGPAFDLFDEFMGAMEATFSDRNLSWSEKYKLARDKWRQISDAAWEEQPWAYGTGSAVGMLGTGVGAAKAGIQGLKGAAALGALSGAGQAENGLQDTLEGAAVGALAAPVVEKVGLPVIKAIGQGADTLLGGMPSAIIEPAVDKITGASKSAREGFRKLGRQIKNTKDIPGERSKAFNEIIKSEENLSNNINQHIDEWSGKEQSILKKFDEYLESKGEKAFDSGEITSIITNTLKKLRNDRTWLKMKAVEKEKLLNLLRDFKDRIVFGTPENAAEYRRLKFLAEDKKYGVYADKWFKSKIENLTEKFNEKTAKEFLKKYTEWEKTTGLDNAIEKELSDFVTEAQKFESNNPKVLLKNIKELLNKRTSPDVPPPFYGEIENKNLPQFSNEVENLKKLKASKIIEDQDAASILEQLADNMKTNRTFEEMRSIKNDLQHFIYSGGEVNLKTTNSGMTGKINAPSESIKDKNLKSIIIELENNIRNKLDEKALPIAKQLGEPQTWKDIRNELSNSMAIRDNLPTISDKKQLTNEFISNRSPDVTNILQNTPGSQLQQKVQAHWEDMAPTYDLYDKLTKFQNRELDTPFRKTLQFNLGSVGSTGEPQMLARRGVQEAAIKAKGDTQISPALSYVIPRDIGKIDHLPLYFLGINNAIAGEELMQSLETADDVSLERGLGELAPQMEGLYQASPVYTSKGRARSAIITRSGTEARIVDSLERKVIRDDIYNDNSLSTIDKAKKAHKLNMTEKLDLDIQDQRNPEPQKVVEMPMMDIYGNLNQVGQQ